MSIYHVIGFTFDMKILNYLLETNTYRSASQIYLGVLTCVIFRVGNRLQFHQGFLELSFITRKLTTCLSFSFMFCH